MTSSFSQFLLCLIWLAALSWPAQAAKPDLPMTLSGVDTLNAEALITLAQGVDDLIVVDSRLAEDRDLGFISESHGLTDTDTSCTTLARISADRERSLVFYCNGGSCIRSVNALKVAKQCGYKQLYWFRGGFKEWQEKDYPFLID